MGQGNSSKGKKSEKTLDKAVINFCKSPLITLMETRKDMICTNGSTDFDENNNFTRNEFLKGKSSSTSSFTPVSFIKSTLSKFLFSNGKSPKSVRFNELPLTGKASRNKRSQNKFFRPSNPEMLNVRQTAPLVIMQAIVQPEVLEATVMEADNASIVVEVDKPASTPSSKSSMSSTSSPKSGSSNNKNIPPPSTTLTTKKKTPRTRTTLPPKRNLKEKELFSRTGCCTKIAPPAYLDYSSAGSCGKTKYGVGNRWTTGNPIIDRLKNVDVIEELQYQVPGQNSGDCKENNDPDFDYFYICDDCGEMREAESPCKGSLDSKCKTNPVTYSRRQRFNFMSTKNAMAEDEEEDGPPFKWPGDSNCCGCPCCVAGLRRNPNCECKCCQVKGQVRVVNSFDEIPVGKNPEPRPKKPCICEEKEEDEEILPKESGVYFYDAEENRFIRQIPRTPTPIVLERRKPTAPLPPQNEPRTLNYQDICQLLQSLPSRNTPTKQQDCLPFQPMMLPPICGLNNNCAQNMFTNCGAMVSGLFQGNGNALGQCNNPPQSPLTKQQENSSNPNDSNTKPSHSAKPQSSEKNLIPENY